MGIKKKSKVSAQFNMSSLTDIIFLLLIFFMLTSSLVAPNALNLKLPGSSNSTSTSTDRLDDISISRSGSLYWNGKRTSISALERSVGAAAGSRPQKYNVTISPERGAPTESVVEVLDLTRRLRVNGVLTVEPN